MAGYCPSGKIRHDDRTKAHDHLVAMRRNSKGIRGVADLHAYLCPECDGWHVGHKIGSRRRKAK